MSREPESKSANFEVVTTRLGAKSIRNIALNETMHNPVGPWEEANSLYIEPSRLKARLSQNLKEELVVFDMGLGAAANAVATLHAFDHLKKAKRALRLISFEQDLTLTEFAWTHAAEFDHLQSYKNALRQLLDTGRFERPGLTWELRQGDGLEQMAQCQVRPQLIFYDPYSFHTNPGMWTLDTFRKVYAVCRKDLAEPTLLLTYSQATPIRSALLLSGFFVGHGPKSGPKEETTQACTQMSGLVEPLGEKWLKRWRASHIPLPPLTKDEDRDLLTSQILGHFQFRERTTND